MIRHIREALADPTFAKGMRIMGALVFTMTTLCLFLSVMLVHQGRGDGTAYSFAQATFIAVNNVVGALLWLRWSRASN